MPRGADRASAQPLEPCQEPPEQVRIRRLPPQICALRVLRDPGADRRVARRAARQRRARVMRHRRVSGGDPGGSDPPSRALPWLRGWMTMLSRTGPVIWSPRRPQWLCRLCVRSDMGEGYGACAARCGRLADPELGGRGVEPWSVPSPGGGRVASTRFAPQPGLAAAGERRLRAGQISELHEVYGGLGSGRLVIAQRPGSGQERRGRAADPGPPCATGAASRNRPGPRCRCQ